MKTTERHDLKHNEVADTLQEAYVQLDQNRKTILIGAVVVAVAWPAWGGYRYFATDSRKPRRARCWPQALVVVEAPVAPPSCARAGPARTANACRQLSERAGEARGSPAEAARRRRRVSDALRRASRRGTRPPRRSMAQGKTAEARTQYETVVADGGRGLYAPDGATGPRRARRQGGQYDPAIATLRELSLDAKGDLPVDAVLVRLARRLRRRRQEDRGAAGAPARDHGVCDLAVRGGRQEAARHHQGRRVVHDVTVHDVTESHVTQTQVTRHTEDGIGSRGTHPYTGVHPSVAKFVSVRLRDPCVCG